MNALKSMTFEVSNVERARTPLPEVPYKEAVEALLTRSISPEEREHLDWLRDLGRSVILPESTPSRPLEACAKYHGRLLAEISYHPVVAAVHHAFVDHRPLSLSPDMIWLMIIQGVAHHINAHAEKLRSRIVSQQGKVTIEVRRDDFVKGSPENPWSEVFHDFSAKIRDHIGTKIDAFVPVFTTTGLVERAAAEVVLLDAMQSYFEYLYQTFCGIPTISLEGTSDDWKSIVERVLTFREFGLERWIDVLTPILDQFARASQGEVDQGFWRSLYKSNSQSGGPVITGWITAFFPYLKSKRTNLANLPSRIFDEAAGNEVETMLYPGGKPRSEWATGPTMEQFPGGLSKAPFRWDYLDRSFDMEFLGGFVGVAQDLETLTLRPEIGWAVREAPAAK